MAYTVSAGNNFVVNHTSLNGYSLGASTCSLFIMAQSSSIAAAQCALGLASASAVTENSIGLYLRGDTGGDPIQTRWVSPSGNSVAANSAAYSANTWYAAGGRANAPSGAAAGSVFKDGTKTDATATGTLVAFALQRIGIGVNSQNNGAFFFDELAGIVARAAFWKINLIDTEWEALAKGVSPRKIRPQHLVFYHPLVRSPNSITAVPDAALLTTRGSPTVSTHPRSYGF
jgi:hypothetical protein